MDEFDIEADLEETITGIRDAIIILTHDTAEAQVYAQRYINEISHALLNMDWQKAIELSKAEREQWGRVYQDL